MTPAALAEAAHLSGARNRAPRKPPTYTGVALYCYFGSGIHAAYEPILRAVKANPGCTYRKIREMIPLYTPSHIWVVHLVLRLVDEGFIRMEPLPALRRGRRENGYFLTESGKSLFPAPKPKAPAAES